MKAGPRTAERSGKGRIDYKKLRRFNAEVAGKAFPQVRLYCLEAPDIIGHRS